MNRLRRFLSQPTGDAGRVKRTCDPRISGAKISGQKIHYEIDGKELLDAVDFAGRPGEFVGVIGPNGAGKTTLLRALSRLLAPSSGKVYLDHQDLAKQSSRRIAQQVALVPQATLLDFGFTCLEVVLMGRNPHLNRFQLETEQDRSLAWAAMRQTAVEQLAERLITELSSGERQRVFVARALAQEPRLLLLDEPTSNLDVNHQLQLLGLVRGLVDHGLTAVAAIHDLALAARYCDRLVLLDEGRALAAGTVEDVLTPENLARAFGVRAVVEHDPWLDKLRVTVLSVVTPNPVSAPGQAPPQTDSSSGQGR